MDIYPTRPSGLVPDCLPTAYRCAPWALLPESSLWKPQSESKSPDSRGDDHWQGAC